MIADRRAKQPRGRTAKPAVAAEHQDLCGGLVDDREWIALAVVGCDHPARELDHRAGDLLVLRKLVDGGDRRGGSRAEARERQRQHPQNRSEERRSGKECVSTCSSRWSPYTSTTNLQQQQSTQRNDHSIHN